MKKWAPRRSGFTVAELLVVIVVIVILATIVIVAYGNVQGQARDTKRKDDLASVVSSIQLWSAATNGTFSTMMAGAGGSEIGWFDGAYSPHVSVKDFFVTAGYLDAGIVDPINTKGGTGSKAYMITFCEASEPDTRVIMAQLENAPSETINQQIGRTCTHSSYTSYQTSYGMNYGRVIEL